MFEVCLHHDYAVFEVCLHHDYAMFEVCLCYAWPMLGPCLRYVCTVRAVFALYTHCTCDMFQIVNIIWNLASELPFKILIETSRPVLEI